LHSSDFWPFSAHFAAVRPFGNSSGNFGVDPVDGGRGARQIAQGKVETGPTSLN